jgi:hypothetical protein
MPGTATPSLLNQVKQDYRGNTPTLEKESEIGARQQVPAEHYRQEKPAER